MVNDRLISGGSSSGPAVAAAVPENLEGMEPGWRTAYEATLGALAGGGVRVERQDVSWLLDAAKLLYGGTLLAERGNAFGEVLQQMGGDADPSVAAIVLPSLEYRAVDLVADQQRLVSLAPRVRESFERFDALILPTAPGHPTVEAVAADPIGVNSWVGTFTNFVNLLDLSALAVPAAPGGSSVESGSSGRGGGATNAGDSANVEVMLIGPAFGDVVLRQIAAAWVPELRHTGEDPLWGAPRVRLAVFGAHRRGQPLNGQLREAGASFAGMAATAPNYRMGVLD